MIIHDVESMVARRSLFYTIWIKPNQKALTAVDKVSHELGCAALVNNEELLSLWMES